MIRPHRMLALAIGRHPHCCPARLLSGGVRPLEPRTSAILVGKKLASRAAATTLMPRLEIIRGTSVDSRVPTPLR